MFKSLLISLNLVGLALIPMFYVGEVSVNVDAPSTMNAGEDVEVTLTLNKGTATGPARIKLNFDEAIGLSAEEIENSGASFSFSDGVGLYIWYSIPEEETLTLKFRLHADGSASGTKNITGTFSYLDGEERKKVIIPTISLNVEGATTASNANETNTNTENNNHSMGTSTTTEPQTNSLGDISCTRSIEELGTEAIVTLTIRKGSNGGFARIKENVPSGFTAEKIEANGSVFKFSDNIVKFLWSSVNPSQEELVVKYKLTPSEGMTGSYSVDGSFTGEFLIVNDEPQTIEIQTSTFNITGEALASNETNSNNGSENNNTTNTNNTSTNTTESNENNNNTASNNSNTSENETNGSNVTNNNTSIETTHNNNTGSNGVNYKVQVLAAHKTVSNSYIKKRYGYSGSVDLENHQGWTKYTTGQFNTYRDARDKRESLSSYNFPGPFVTAYNNGERITVQEALMLTNQKWVQ